MSDAKEAAFREFLIKHGMVESPTVLRQLAREAFDAGWDGRKHAQYLTMVKSDVCDECDFSTGHFCEKHRRPDVATR